MKTVVTHAIVLRRVDYGEADRIVTVLSEEVGKVSVLARGVRKLKSKLAGGLELLAVNELSLIEGKGELFTLRSARTKQQFSGLLESYDRNEQAFSALKQINELVEETEGKEFYPILHAYLAALDDGLSLPLAETWWILRLLTQLGHTPNLTTDADGAKLDPDKNYLFHPEEGTLRITAENREGAFSADHIKLWRLALHLEPMSLGSIKGGSDLATDVIDPLRHFFANSTH